jgi:hypothetical protein
MFCQILGCTPLSGTGSISPEGTAAKNIQDDIYPLSNVEKYWGSVDDKMIDLI